MITWKSIGLNRRLRHAEAIDEGPIRIAVEQIAITLRVRRIPDVVAIETTFGPFLMGLVRPQIVLPGTKMADLNGDQLRAVLMHEMAHWHHCDTWVGWIQVTAQSLLWFHPFLWWANAQLRHERECVCDETVLRMSAIAPEDYSDAIFRVLTASRGRSLAGSSLVGVFERGSNLQNRLEEIMNYEPAKSRFGWLSGVALVAFGIVFVPMSPALFSDRFAEADETAKPAVKKRLKDRYQRRRNDTENWSDGH